MTIEEFNNTKWHAGMKVEVLSGAHKGKIFPVVTLHLDQQLIGVDAYGDNEEIVWIRCENCMIVNE